MSDNSDAPRSKIQKLVAEYLAIVKKFGVESDKALAFRNAHPDCPGLDDVDAAFVAVDAGHKRRRVRGCLLGLIAFFGIGIAALGILFSSQATWMKDKFVAATTEFATVKGNLEETVSRKEEEITKKSKDLEKASVDLRKVSDNLMETEDALANTSDDLKKTARERDAARNLGQQISNISSYLNGTTGDDTQEIPPADVQIPIEVEVDDKVIEEHQIAIESSAPNSSLIVNGKVSEHVTIPKDQDRVEASLQVKVTEDLQTVSLGTSSGTISPSAATVIRENVTKSPKTVTLALLQPVSAADSAIVKLQSANPNVNILVSGNETDRVVVAPGETKVQFELSSKDGTAIDAAHIIATVEGASPFLKRPAPESAAPIAETVVPVLPKELRGLPATVIGDGKAVSVAIALEQRVVDNNGITVDLKSTNPKVTFLANGQAVTSLTLMPSDEQIRFEIVANDIQQPEAACVSLHQGAHPAFAALLVMPPTSLSPPPSPAAERYIESITLSPPATVISDGTFDASLKLARKLTSEEIDKISLTASNEEAVQVKRKKLDPDSNTIDFQVTTKHVDEPLPLQLAARFGEPSSSPEAELSLTLLPKPSQAPEPVRPSLVSISVKPQDKEGEVKLDRAVKGYRQVVFLRSDAPSVVLPEYVIVEPDKTYATFPVSFTTTTPRGEIRVTATLDDQRREATFSIAATDGTPATDEPEQPQLNRRPTCSQSRRRLRRR